MDAGSGSIVDALRLHDGVMKRSTKSSAPPQIENPPSARPRKAVHYDVDPAPPTFPTHSSSPLRVTPPPPPPVPSAPASHRGGGEGARISAPPPLPPSLSAGPTHSRDAETVSVSRQALPPEVRAAHWAPQATIPLTPAVEWEPPGSSPPPTGAAAPVPPMPRLDLPSNRSVDGWSGVPSDSDPSASGPREANPRSSSGSGHTSPRSQPHPHAEPMPFGYVVASAFFLAVAVVGFGLWLAFEVL